jgi:hypothetical protein
VTQSVTIRFDRETVRKARILAARRDTSISGFVAAQIEALVKPLDSGFRLGGVHRGDRAQLYDR